MRGVISAPRGVITGAFNILFTFQREIELTREAITIEVLEGDALGHAKDTFGGSGKNYHLLCYVPDAVQGRSRISVAGFDVPPVDIAYDTVREITPVWGDPFREAGNIEIPLTLPEPVQNLRKGNFRVSRGMQHYLYGSEQAYHFVVSRKEDEDFSITVLGSVEKANGIEARITPTVIEISPDTIS